jgi:hypothetical protein
MPFPEREDLLELIDDDHRRHRVVAPVPEHRPMQELPQGLVRLAGFSLELLLDPVACQGLCDRRADLADEAGVRAGVVESHRDRKELLAREARKEACLQQRRLAGA